jgi:hypothetical protein
MIASSTAVEEPRSPLGGQVFAAALSGLVATLVTITVTIAPGPRAFELIGVEERDARAPAMWKRPLDSRRTWRRDNAALPPGR